MQQGSSVGLNRVGVQQRNRLNTICKPRPLTGAGNIEEGLKGEMYFSLDDCR
jgi:hypothetical protein